MRLKYLTMTLASFVSMFQISWSLMLVDILAIFLVGLTQLLQKVCLRKTKSNTDA